MTIFDNIKIITILVNVNPSKGVIMLNEIDKWLIVIIVYCLTAVLSFIPVLVAIFRKVKLLPGGADYNSSPFFSERQKERLNQHYTRIQGTLGYWKNKAAKNYRFHIYTIIWTTAISIVLPILIQALGNESNAKILLTIISVHSALLIGFHRAFKVERNYQTFRVAESEFYDLRRNFLDNAYKNQKNMDSVIDDFFESVTKLRIMARKEEVDNTPTLKHDKE